MSTQRRQPAVFLDRDGVLIRDVGYLSSEDDIDILAGVPQALRALKDHGLKVVVVTNQSGVARGRLTEDKLIRIHAVLIERLAQEHAEPDGIYYCPHHPTEGLGPYRVTCNCRKPSIGLVEKAAKELQLDPSRSYVIGDQRTDMELSKRIGAKGIWIRGQGLAAGVRIDSCFVANDLRQAVGWILACRNNLTHARGDE
jgi:D-glycero-D-manno-heptose 1,7-bisphosphate phosphatase